MREKTIKVYEFNELSEYIQERVLNNNREINVDYNWWENDECLLEFSSDEIKKYRIGKLLK